MNPEASADRPRRRWLGLCGSLRRASLHRELLRECVSCAPPAVELVLHASIRELPHFDPDLDEAAQPAVAVLRAALVDADAVLIASPEYAHGIAGAMKNALDWMVGNESFVGKPVLIVSASARARAAPDALREVLTTMSARVAPFELTVPLLGMKRVEGAPIPVTARQSAHESLRRFDEYVSFLGQPAIDDSLGSHARSP